MYLIYKCAFEIPYFPQQLSENKSWMHHYNTPDLFFKSHNLAVRKFFPGYNWDKRWSASSGYFWRYRRRFDKSTWQNVSLDGHCEMRFAILSANRPWRDSSLSVCRCTSAWRLDRPSSRRWWRWWRVRPWWWWWPRPPPWPRECSAGCDWPVLCATWPWAPVPHPHGFW